ncbi:MAG: hypothetical protein MRZ29_04940 [Oscillospiraceae bacterium]|nr:hypothetical protein [Oscillospiraceae bacterium]
MLRFSFARKTSARFLAPPFSQKGTFATAIRLQAHSLRLWLTTTFLRAFPFKAHFWFFLVVAKFALLRFSLARKTSARFLAPPFSQKGSFASAIRLQAHSLRLWLHYHLFASVPSEQDIFIGYLSHNVGAKFALLHFFFGKKNIRPLPCSSFFAKRHIHDGYSFASALITAHGHLFHT